MTQDELRQVQLISLDMARAFAGFCRRHGLLCYLCGGGCIGALRHRGMIPWDDDLDFFMPREDYERAWRLWQEEMAGSRYVLERPSEALVTHDLFFKIRDSQTTYVKGHQRDVSTVHGVALDVLPLDGCPSGVLQRLDQVFWACIYSLYCAQLVPQNNGPAARLVGAAMLALVPSGRLRNRIWRFAERRMTRFAIRDAAAITELCSGVGYMRNRYPKEAFASAVYVPFEDIELPIPVGASEYLAIAFGDYMQFPPEEQRVPTHQPVFMDLTRSYTQYKGVECA